MRLLDEQYIETPFYGIDKMTEWLRRQGHYVNHKRVRRLMRQMGLEAVYPRRRRGLSLPDKEHKIYPYLLRDVQIIRPDQVWSADITYVRMYRGWLYLVAVMDWFSRYVLSWEVSVTLEADFCVLALEQALSFGKPEIFNTDQGSQFTSIDFTKILLNSGVQISMDGKGRVFDNIFSERLWRTVKVEEVYLRDYQTVAEATYLLGRYFELYNNQRLHQALGYRTPAEVYGVAVGTPVALPGSLIWNDRCQLVFDINFIFSYFFQEHPAVQATSTMHQSDILGLIQQGRTRVNMNILRQELSLLRS
jgi:putative transposase